MPAHLPAAHRPVARAPLPEAPVVRRASAGRATTDQPRRSRLRRPRRARAITAATTSRTRFRPLRLPPGRGGAGGPVGGATPGWPCAVPRASGRPWPGCAAGEAAGGGPPGWAAGGGVVGVGAGPPPVSCACRAAGAPGPPVPALGPSGTAVGNGPTGGAEAPPAALSRIVLAPARARLAAPSATAYFGCASTTVGRPSASEIMRDDQRDPGRAADQQHGGELVRVDLGRAQRAHEGADRGLDRCPDHVLELGAGELHVEVPVGQEHRDRRLGVDRERLLGQHAVLAQPGERDAGLRVAHVELG